MQHYHWPELNQVALELICENQATSPVYMLVFSGNTHCTKAFAKIMITKNISWSKDVIIFCTGRDTR
ncbi:hypothetical protein DA096_10260 [Vibrio rotiferianus]|nr:hypothetical protein DA095_17415 [Vibrio rotiferianus]TMX48255.1 hypothetical protein DA093_17025 [Vibrio rotiferianus]TMX63439.1 hypothetical protein DA097_14570 [Vibrio rotiferianus]TMX64141.1 hypothetical protein DA096_10260 [Vibrio rotiferianus]